MLARVVGRTGVYWIVDADDQTVESHLRRHHMLAQQFDPDLTPAIGLRVRLEYRPWPPKRPTRGLWHAAPP